MPDAIVEPAQPVALAPRRRRLGQALMLLALVFAPVIGFVSWKLLTAAAEVRRFGHAVTVQGEIADRSSRLRRSVHRTVEYTFTAPDPRTGRPMTVTAQGDILAADWRTLKNRSPVGTPIRIPVQYDPKDPTVTRPVPYGSKGVWQTFLYNMGGEVTLVLIAVAMAATTVLILLAGMGRDRPIRRGFDREKPPEFRGLC